MKPEDVPADLIARANAAWRTAPQKRDGQPTRMRHALAAVLDEYERQVRERVADELRADADARRRLVERKPSQYDDARLASARCLDDAATRLTRRPT